MNIKNFLLDLVFPRHCFGCQKELLPKEESFICDECFFKIRPSYGIQCHICGLRNDQGACLKCQSKTFLKAIFFAGYYDDPILKESVRSFKYDSIESLKKPLSKIIIECLKNKNLLDRLDGAVLIPIPLTFRRKMERGYNQSELLAKEISSVFKFPVLNLLKRQKFNRPQAEVPDWESRKENISGAFILSSSEIKNLKSPIQKAILIDDVSTSGSTLEEAAKTLKKMGVEEIYGLVVAKG